MAETKKVGRPSNAEKEAAELRKQLEELKKQMELMKSQSEPPIVEDMKSDEDAVVRPDKYIKVMSLNFGLLNLTTEPKGRGKIFKFQKFGDVRNIVYGDLANIIHTNQKFAEEGRFYIFNKQVVINHGLAEYYDKFMTKDMIEKILDFDRDKMVDLFTNATKTQRETIVQILIKRIKNGEDVDLNKVDIISRIAGNINIYETAMEYKKE